MLASAFKKAGMKLPAPLRKTLLTALSERDPTADICYLPNGLPEPDPELREHPDENAEARAVAGRIRTLLQRGTRASEVAVLFRTNGQSETFEQALADADVPYVVRGGERFFDRPEVREARLLFRGAARAAAGEPLPSAVRTMRYWQAAQCGAASVTSCAPRISTPKRSACARSRSANSPPLMPSGNPGKLSSLSVTPACPPTPARSITSVSMPSRAA